MTTRTPPGEPGPERAPGPADELPPQEHSARTSPSGFRRGVRLGVDVGSVRVGVAVSDPDGLLATPVATLARDRRGGDVARIVAEARDRRAIEVVVGLPRSLSGGEGPAAQAARQYAIRVATRLDAELVTGAAGRSPQESAQARLGEADDIGARPAGVSVRLFDERLSTTQAHRVLSRSGMPGRRQRQVVDQVAAVVLLQAALDTERSIGAPAGEQVLGVASSGA
ncbi:MAG: Holliday junction resolvase RuvX [Angustibacter sp.]